MEKKNIEYITIAKVDTIAALQPNKAVHTTSPAIKIMFGFGTEVK